MPPSPPSLVVMGVAGSGKSTLAALLATHLQRPWLEGDAFHTEASRRKMAQGEPLTDGDRASWLASLCDRLRLEAGVILTCSALKRSYREQLRAAAPGLRFAFLDIDKAEADRRVRTRGGHFFSASLIDSQFDTLEPPRDEPGVLRLDALRPLSALQAEVAEWLAA
ncbi:gluconokinase [Roseateles puraquae]|uniref:gluconokinase n=1 Tax=Roseateles puraquae TaxID=431059 RepID=UPI001F4EAE55|nr:gluconokinase [Roseateles puraquae]